MSEDVKVGYDWRRQCSLVYINGEAFPVDDCIIVEKPKLARQLYDNFARADEMLQGLRDTFFGFRFAGEAAAEAFRRLEWALMTKAQRRRWGRRYSREMRGFKMRTERLS